MSDAQVPASWWPAERLDRERWGAVIEPVLQRIVTARDRSRLPHAMLLVGPQGLGRELAAVEAAALLICAKQGGCWCDCGVCRRVRDGIHPDVEAVLPQGVSQQIRIEQIRRLVEAAPGRPFEGAHRVWILDGVEAGRFGAEAANAFLKTLEEPPAHVRFLLLAGNPEAVLPTIRSRCQQLALPGVVAIAQRFRELQGPPELASLALTSDDDVAGFLQPVCASLDSAFSGEVIDLLRLARLLGDSQRAFEMVAAGALQALDSRQEQAEALVRLADQALACGRRTRALNLNRERQLLSCLLSWYRDLEA